MSARRRHRRAQLLSDLVITSHVPATDTDPRSMSAFRVRPPPCPPPNRPAMSQEEVSHIMSYIYIAVACGVFFCAVQLLRANPQFKVYLTALQFRYQRWLNGPMPVPTIAPREPPSSRSGGAGVKFGAKPGRAKASSSSSSSKRSSGKKGRRSAEPEDEVPLQGRRRA